MSGDKALVFQSTLHTQNNARAFKGNLPNNTHDIFFNMDPDVFILRCEKIVRHVCYGVFSVSPIRAKLE